MGWSEVRIEIVGVRSNHNSADDDLDRAKWDYLLRRINEELARPGMGTLRAEVMPRFDWTDEDEPRTGATRGPHATEMTDACSCGHVRASHSLSDPRHACGYAHCVCPGFVLVTPSNPKEGG